MEKKLLERFAKKIAKSKFNRVQDQKGNDKKVINYVLSVKIMLIDLIVALINNILL